jgi:hypothetical protein
MPELTDNQIADLRDLQHHCAALRAELVIIGAIAGAGQKESVGEVAAASFSGSGRAVERDSSNTCR